MNDSPDMETPHDTDAREAFGPAPEDAPTAAFLGRLFTHVGRVSGPGLEPLAREPLTLIGRGASWPETLEAACRHVGARTRAVERTCAEACTEASLVSPIATWTPAVGWIALTRIEGTSAIVVRDDGAEARWTATELAGLLGLPDEHRTHRWLEIEAGLSAVRSAPGHVHRPFKRLLELIRPERVDVVTIVLYAVFVGLLTLATPIAVQQLVNTVAFGGLVQPVVVLALLLFGGLAFSATLSAFQTYLAELIQRRVFVRACLDLADRLPRVRVDAYGNRHGPELVNRFFDLVTIQKTGATLLIGGTSIVLQTVAGLIILSFYHPLMLAFSILLISGIGFVVFRLGFGATDTAIGESNAKYALAEWMEELARHPAAFRDRASRGYAIARADTLAAQWVDARRRHFRIVLRQIVGSLGLQVAASTIILGLGGFLVVAGQLTLGQLVASEIIVTAVVAAVARLGKQLESFYDLLAAVEKVGVLVDLPLERETGSTPGRPNGPAALAAKDVGFVRDGFSVLRDVSIRIEPGERVALVGPTAGGKSTLLDLLCGLRAPTTGSVTIDGDDVRDLRLEALRERIFHLREPEVFSGTIVENLRVGRRTESVTDLNDALARVGLLDEVRALPDGLETRLATDGGPLSRSQVVRLMLARAILARPRLLALDDALVHLDGERLEVAADLLFDRTAPWTLVMVTHDDRLLARCDRTIDLGRPGETVVAGSDVGRSSEEAGPDTRATPEGTA